MAQHLKQRSDGRYGCRYQDKYFVAKTEAEALKMRDEYKLSLLRAQPAAEEEPTPMTVAEYADVWLPLHKRNVARRTYTAYERAMGKLKSQVGTMPISNVTASDIQKVWTIFDGKSGSTIRFAKVVYTSMFDTAVEDGYIRFNPCKSHHSKPPKGKDGSHRAITQEERNLILATQHSLRPAIMVMLYAGLRRGEALALNIDTDVDFEHHLIHVRHAIRYESNQPILSAPKTEAGVRDIPMVELLEKELQGKHGLLMPAKTTGSYMTEIAFKRGWDSYLYALEQTLNHSTDKRWFKGEWQEVNIRAHDLRHSYCTMLRDCGVDIKLAMQWMGHSDETMILRIYDHVTEFRVQQALEQLEKMLQDN